MKLVPEASAFEVEMAIEKLKRHKSSGIDQTPANCLKQGVEHFARRSINLLIIFRLRRNCLESVGSRSLYLFIRRVIKQSVVNIEARQFYIWVSVHHKSIKYIINQQDATLAVLCLLTTTSMLYMFRTPFASIIRSTINCNWNKSWIDVQGRCTLYYSMANMWHFDHWIVQCATDLEHLYRIYSIPTYEKHQWLLLRFIVLLMMDAKGVRNM